MILTGSESPGLLALLLAFFFPHAEVGAGEADDTDEGQEDDAEDGLDAAGDGDDNESDESDEPAPDDADDDAGTPPVRKAASSGSKDAAEAVRLAREAADAVRNLTAQQTAAKPDAQHEAEDAKLRDPNTTDLEKWQIQSDRVLRESRRQSQQALFQAHDMADKTDYAAKSLANPIYSKYKDRVEAELDKARKAGASPNREFVLDVLIGRDMRLGNFKAKAAPAKPVPRGKPTGARSDTPARGTRSEREKRVARLSDRPI